MARSKLTNISARCPTESTYGTDTILNNYNASNPVEVICKGDVWKTTYDGVVHKLDWHTLSFPKEVLFSLKSIANMRLRTHAPSDLSQIRIALNTLSKMWKRDWVDFGDIGVDDWSELWSQIKPGVRVSVRSIYRNLAEADLSGADLFIADELSHWNARHNTKHLGYVLDWHPLRGALTASECELVRRAVSSPIEGETPKEQCIRVLIWTLIETLKRSRQLLLIELNGLKPVCEDDNSSMEYFLTVPKVKRQRGYEAEWWPISKELGCAIIDLKSHPEFIDVRTATNRLFVWSSPLRSNGIDEIPSWEVKEEVSRLIRSYKIFSKRARGWLHVTPNRIRHTGATTLAMQGVNRDTIQYILEHSSPMSANAYIDAVGSTLLPSVDRADRKLGGIFSDLSNCFFKGHIVDEVKSKPIYIPKMGQGIALVGGCGRDETKNGTCQKHPFFACYSGCPNFLAWKDGKHDLAKEFVKSRLDKWNAAAGGPSKSKAIQEYERVYKGVSEVIEAIDEIEGHD